MARRVRISLLGMILAGLTVSCQKPLVDQSMRVRAGGVEDREMLSGKDGAYQAHVKATGEMGQRLKSGGLQGTSVFFPPGALSVDTDISVAEGSDVVDSAAMDEMGMSATDVGARGLPIEVAASAPMDTNVPMQLELPLPNSTGLVAADSFEMLVVIGVMNDATDGGFRMRIWTRAELEVFDKRGMVGFQTRHFGTFQAVLMTVKVEKAVEKTMATDPMTQTSKTVTQSEDPATPSDTPAEATVKATALAFVAEPSTTVVAGQSLGTVKVAARDSSGQVVTTFTGSIALSLAADPSSGAATLAGTLTKNAVSGIATFTGLSLNKVATGYRLSATASGLTAATSGTIAVTAGTVASLGIAVQPAAVAAGSTMTPDVEIKAYDAHGNLAGGFTGNISLAVKTGPLGGSILSGAGPVAATSGSATFSGLSFDKAGAYVLTASDGTHTVNTQSFTVTPAAASELYFVVQPSDVEVLETMTPAVKVGVRDAYGNAITGATGTVTLTIASGSGTISSGDSATLNSGVATFSGIVFSSGGTFTLQADDGVLTAATSDSFIVTTPVATAIAFATAPFSAETTTCTAVTIELRDASDATVANYASSAITANLSADSGIFSSSAACSPAISSASIAKGSSSATVYYQGSRHGAASLTVAVTGLTSGALEVRNVEPAGTEIASWQSASASSDGIYGLAIDAEDKVYAAGFGTNLFSGSSGQDWSIRKFDTALNEVVAGWNKVADDDGAYGDVAYGIAYDKANDRVVVFGNYENLTNWKCGIKVFGIDGTEVTTGWDKKYLQSTSDCWLYGGAIDPLGNVYVYGTIKGKDSAYVAKWNHDGTTGWSYVEARQTNAIEFATGAAFDSNGNVFFTGSLRNATNDVWLAGYTPAGAALAGWADANTAVTGLEIDVSAGGYDWGRGIVIDGNDSIYIGGSGQTTSYDWALVQYNSSAQSAATGAWDGGPLDVGGADGFDSVEATCMAPDQSAVFVVGRISNGTDTDWRVAKVTLSGSFDTTTWDLTYDSGSGDDVPFACALNSHGDLYVAGITGAVMDLGAAWAEEVTSGGDMMIKAFSTGL